MITAVSINVRKDKEKNMSMKIKKANGHVVYLPVKINCKKFRTEVGDDGFIEKVRCAAKKRKAECKTCGLNRWK